MYEAKERQMPRKKNGKVHTNGADPWVSARIRKGAVIRRKGKLAVAAKFTVPFADERPGRLIGITVPKRHD